MDSDELKFITGIRGKIVRDVDIKHPGFFSRGYLKFTVEDPDDGSLYMAKINLG